MALKSLGADHPAGSTGSGSDICAFAIPAIRNLQWREEKK